MEVNKTVNIIEIIKSIASGFIGAGIFTQGTFYFQEQPSYNIPRILVPVYDVLGNVGLAIGMIVLGLGLLTFSFIKWKNLNGGIGLYIVIGISAILLFFSVIFLTRKPLLPIVPAENNVAVADEKRAKAIEEIRNMEQPKFGNAEIENHLAAFEIMFKNYEKQLADQNQAGLKNSREGFIVWSKKTATLMESLNVEQKQQLALYVGKLSLKWQEADR